MGEGCSRKGAKGAKFTEQERVFLGGLGALGAMILGISDAEKKRMMLAQSRKGRQGRMGEGCSRKGAKGGEMLAPSHRT
ncbi:MAG: hypothetical protein HY695_02595 [Deltaproteobacteria bacterium]|nr:hypothetical protein [Deltaproteobacteria bacterium]